MLWYRLSIEEQISSNVKERTEEVSLFIAAVMFMMSCLLWVRWKRSGLEI